VTVTSATLATFNYSPGTVSALTTLSNTFSGKTNSELKDLLFNNFTFNPSTSGGVVDSTFHFMISQTGEDSFKFQVLNYATTKKVLDQLEIKYIKQYNCLNRDQGYNLMSGGANGKPSEESRKKMSDAKKGKKVSLETRKKMSISNGKYWLGKSFSEQHLKNLSESHKGKKLPEAQRIKIGNSGRGKQYGKYRGTWYLHKVLNPWKKVWRTQIRYNGKMIPLGYFNDPISGEIVYDLVFKEIYGED
jgi:hypothetical protein